MYIPAHFSVDPDGVKRMLSDLVAADLVTSSEGGLSATFLPLLYDPAAGEQGSVKGHVARTNHVWRQKTLGEALVIGHGPNGYVSPSWYPSKDEHGRVVPTWNYLTLHIHGRLVVHDDVAWVEDIVRRLTERHESDREQPWSVDDAPNEYLAGQLRAIVGVEVVITGVEAKAKLSQNRPPADIDGVVAGLLADGRADVATEVERHRR
jgi:transcriptional regulator